jgi:hypothetical protein
MDSDFIKGLQSTAQQDQALEAARFLAVMVRHYYKELRDQGFNAIEALTLTTNMQNTMLHQTKSQGQGEAP